MDSVEQDFDIVAADIFNPNAATSVRPLSDIEALDSNERSSNSPTRVRVRRLHDVRSPLRIGDESNRVARRTRRTSADASDVISSRSDVNCLPRLHQIGGMLNG